MSRALRDLRGLLDRLIQGDSYGVEGSDFAVCLVCQHESGAGVLAREHWHAKDCPVPRLERKWKRPYRRATNGVIETSDEAQQARNGEKA